MSEKFTAQGDWHRNIPPVTRYPIIFAGRNTHIARIITEGLSPEEAEANTNLIVASPKMYLALKEARNYILEFGSDKDMAPVIELIDQALAKADGNIHGTR